MVRCKRCASSIPRFHNCSPVSVQDLTFQMKTDTLRLEANDLKVLGMSRSRGISTIPADKLDFPTPLHLVLPDQFKICVPKYTDQSRTKTRNESHLGSFLSAPDHHVARQLLGPGQHLPCTQKQLKNHAYSEDQCEAMRPLLHNLYMEKCLSLQAVIDIMAKEWNFFPT